MEFIEFSIEADEEFSVLAHTEQGLWATVFVDLYEDRGELQIEDFREPARMVGFRFLERVLSSHSGADLTTFDARRGWLLGQVECIDRESCGPAGADGADVPINTKVPGD
jgi:hypothetical protein